MYDTKEKESNAIVPKYTYMYKTCIEKGLLTENMKAGNLPNMNFQ
jgi:hypothetical protein